MSAIALGLGLQERFFDNLIQEQYHNLRLLNYPSIPSELLQAEGTSRAGAHSGQFCSSHDSGTSLIPRLKITVL
jgi:isopenicillin N synthase-like dioxygenase